MQYHFLIITVDGCIPLVCIAIIRSAKVHINFDLFWGNIKSNIYKKNNDNVTNNRDFQMSR